MCRSSSDREVGVGYGRRNEEGGSIRRELRGGVDKGKVREWGGEVKN